MKRDVQLWGLRWHGPFQALLRGKALNKDRKRSVLSDTWMLSLFSLPLDPFSQPVISLNDGKLSCWCLSLPFYPSLAHALFLSSLFCISSRWKLHLLQSSFLPKSQGHSICGMRGKKVLGCSFHHWDNYPHCDLNDPSCSARVSCTRPATRLQALTGSSPLLSSPNVLCQGIWKPL